MASGNWKKMLGFLFALGCQAEVRQSGCDGEGCEADNQVLLQRRGHKETIQVETLGSEPSERIKNALEWRKKIIYQVVPDRFALPPGTQNDTCKIGSCTVRNPNKGCNSVPVCDYGNFCGGKLSGLESKLDYISGMNMDAIWITPVTQNTECGFMGYWTQDLNAVSKELGGQEQLLSLSKAMRAKGLKYLQDVVYNHFGPPPPNGSFKWINAVDDETNPGDNQWNGVYTSFSPFNETSHYHGTADNHCNAPWFEPKNTWASFNQTMQRKCWLTGLADLDQSVPFVREQLFNWTRSIFKDFGADALRLDTVGYLDPEFYYDLRSEALGDHYVFGEVLGNLAEDSRDIVEKYYINYTGGWMSASAQFQQSWDGGEKGLGAITNYAYYMAMFDAFAITKDGFVRPNNIGLKAQTGADSFLLPVGSLSSLRSIILLLQKTYGSGAFGWGALNNFIENQDQPRFLYLICRGLTVGWEPNGDAPTPYGCDVPSVSSSPAPVLLYMNALTITFMVPGVPSVYFGGEQAMVAGGSDNGIPSNGPNWDHYRSSFRAPMWLTGYSTDASLYGFITRLAELRRDVIGKMGLKEIDEMRFVEVSGSMVNLTDYVIAFERGHALVVSSNLANRLSEMDLQTDVVMQTKFAEGEKVCDVLCYRSPSAQYSFQNNNYDVQFPGAAPDSCDCAVVGADGELSVTLGNEPRIYVPEKKVVMTS